jgi:dolichol-phosphate mannosyltransferase
VLFQISDVSINKGTEEDRCLKFSLVLPTYNEAGNIQDIVKILSNLLDQFIPGDYELIVVDDNSPDNTWKLALELTLRISPTSCHASGGRKRTLYGRHSRLASG